VRSQIVCRGRILALEVQDVRLENGREALREIVRHGPAVAVLARRPDGRFVFVRQYRKPVEQELIEVVAGNRNAGEDAAACALRELKEETGYRAARMVPLGHIYPSAGYVDERIDLFFAELPDGAGEARPDEDEHLEVVVLSRAEFLERVRGGGVPDAKTLAAWQQYEVRFGSAGS
jgi:ADP-ribose pyrophosphatase